MRLNQKVILLVSILAGFFAFSLTFKTLSNLQKSGDVSPVVTAFRDLEIGQILNDEDVKLMPAPNGADIRFAFTNMNEAVGKMMRKPVQQGHVMTSEDVARPDEGLSSLIPNGYRAKDVPADLPKESLDLLKFGARVDLLFVDQANPNLQPKTMMKNVLVLGVNNQTASITVAVPPAGTETIAYAISKGKVQISIRPRGEIRAAEEYMSLNELMGVKQPLPTALSFSGIEVIKGTKKERVEL